MRRTGLPTWLIALLVMFGLMFFGPPLLGLLGGAIGLAIGLIAVTVKFGIIALGVYAAVLLLKAMFGSSPRPQRARTLVPPADILATPHVDEEKRALDAELARMMAEQGRTL